jgi:hypothetical protein
MFSGHRIAPWWRAAAGSATWWRVDPGAVAQRLARLRRRPERARGGRQAPARRGTSRPSSITVLLCPRATRATRTGFSVTHMRRHCPSRRSVLLSGRLHRRARCSPATRSSERDSPAITCAVLPVAGLDIDLPVVQARCRVQRNGRLVPVQPGGRRRSRCLPAEHGRPGACLRQRAARAASSGPGRWRAGR